MRTTTLFILISFLLGILFCLSNKHADVIENFGFSSKCPNLLIKKGCKIELLNTKKAKIPGVNPVIFNNLEEYTEYVKWQKFMGIHCPVLYLQQTYNTQGKKRFQVMDSIEDPTAGYPNTENPTFRKVFMDAGEDNYPFNVGKITDP